MENPTIVFPAAREVRIEDREKPTPADDEVLVETEQTLLSTGTELTVLSGEYPEGSAWDNYGTYPFVAGYVNVGTVAESGPDADIEPGMRVASWSPHAKWVTPTASDCLVVPDDISDEEASLFAIAQVVMNGVRRGRLTWGETAVVYGLGILGQLAVRICRLAGAETVVAFDLAESRRDFLPEDPGVVTADPTAVDPESFVTEHAGRQADVVFEVTGNPDVIEQEFEVLRDQGRLVILSSPHGETTLDFHDLVNGPSHEIIGAHQLSHPPVATPQDPWTKQRHAELFFQYLRDDRLDVDGFTTHTERYENAPGLYHELLEDRTDAMAVRMEW